MGYLLPRNFSWVQPVSLGRTVPGEEAGHIVLGIGNANPVG
jgi:hypothetical protein